VSSPEPRRVRLGVHGFSLRGQCTNYYEPANCLVFLLQPDVNGLVALW